MSEGNLYTSRLVIEIIDEATGERVNPGNNLVDSTTGLSPEAASQHHYVLKRTYARALLDYKAGDVNDSAVEAANK